MRTVKACLSPQACFVLEARRMVREAAEPKAGDGIKAQIRNAASNLGVDYGMAWRAWQGRIGSRAFPKLYAAYLAWDAKHGASGRGELQSLHERLTRLEQLVDRGNSQTAGETSQPRPRSRMGRADLKVASG